MEALTERLAGNGGSSVLLVRAGSPVGGASAGLMSDGGQNVVPPWESVPMEALTERLTGYSGSSAVPAPVSLAAAIAVVRAAVAAAPEQLAMAGYVAAAEFAAEGVSDCLCRRAVVAGVIGESLWL
jgi:hypothetical protein